mmetsp:Transcript_3430/g.9592  ORF Transcript_3430/g.9592 Transcript_3430/m.9592 type:complete len:314 (+) Transcript_3430:640-1581(+)
MWQAHGEGQVLGRGVQHSPIGQVQAPPQGGLPVRQRALPVLAQPVLLRDPVRGGKRIRGEAAVGRGEAWAEEQHAAWQGDVRMQHHRVRIDLFSEGRRDPRLVEKQAVPHKPAWGGQRSFFGVPGKGDGRARGGKDRRGLGLGQVELPGRQKNIRSIRAEQEGEEAPPRGSAQGAARWAAVVPQPEEARVLHHDHRHWQHVFLCSPWAALCAHRAAGEGLGPSGGGEGPGRTAAENHLLHGLEGWRGAEPERFPTNALGLPQRHNDARAERVLVPGQGIWTGAEESVLPALEQGQGERGPPWFHHARKLSRRI